MAYPRISLLPDKLFNTSHLNIRTPTFSASHLNDQITAVMGIEGQVEAGVGTVIGRRSTNPQLH